MSDPESREAAFQRLYQLALNQLLDDARAGGADEAMLAQIRETVLVELMRAGEA